MEKKFLVGKTPDNRWLVTSWVDVEKKTKRYEFEEIKPEVPSVVPPDDPGREFEGVGDLLI